MQKQLIFIIILCISLLSACQKAQQASDDIEDLTTSQSSLTNPTNKELEAVRTPCDDFNVQQEAENCAKIEFEKSDAELNQLYAKIINDQKNFAAKAKEQDKALAEKYKKDSENLVQAQDSWATFRKFNCQAEKELNLETTNSGFNEYSCLQRLTEDRIEDLKLIYQNK